MSETTPDLYCSECCGYLDDHDDQCPWHKLVNDTTRDSTLTKT